MIYLSPSCSERGSATLELRGVTSPVRRAWLTAPVCAHTGDLGKEELFVLHLTSKNRLAPTMRTNFSRALSCLCFAPL